MKAMAANAIQWPRTCGIDLSKRYWYLRDRAYPHRETADDEWEMGFQKEPQMPSEREIVRERWWLCIYKIVADCGSSMLTAMTDLRMDVRSWCGT